MTRRAALAAALLAVLLMGCGPKAGPAAAPAPAQPQAMAGEAPDHELGRRIWNFRCYFCHGYSGDARTLASTYLQPRPRDFTRTLPDALPLAVMEQAITHGKPGTAMKAFQGILQPREITAVAAFVQREFMQARAENTRYHTVDNGWPDHDRHRDAFPFARGEIALDSPWSSLTPAQQRGKQLFLSACISCHDHARVDQPGAVWETRALSYPRDAYCTSCHDLPGDPAAQAPRDEAHRNPGSTPSTQAIATPSAPVHDTVAATYRVHDRPPALKQPSALERRGEALYQRNCAFCHAADGSAKSWIGRFLEPHPRDLTDPAAMAGMTRERLRRVIEDGLEGSSMPGWKQVLAPPEIDAVVAYIHRAFHPVQGL